MTALSFKALDIVVFNYIRQFAFYIDSDNEYYAISKIRRKVVAR